MKLIATATIGGKKTNRVKVQTRRGRPAGRKAEPIEPSPQRAKNRLKQDPSVRGKLYVTTCFSIPVDELVDLDAACERVQMARSQFIRQAVKHFAVKVGE